MTKTFKMVVVYCGIQKVLFALEFLCNLSSSELRKHVHNNCKVVYLEVIQDSSLKEKVFENVNKFTCNFHILRFRFDAMTGRSHDLKITYLRESGNRVVLSQACWFRPRFVWDFVWGDALASVVTGL